MYWPTEISFPVTKPSNEHEQSKHRELEYVIGKAPKEYVFKISPLCQMVPRPTDEEFQRLKEDIEKNGMAHPVIVVDSKTGEVLDGWSRMLIASQLGWPISKLEIYSNARIPFSGDQFKNDPKALIMALSERRGLTVQQRYALAEQMFKAQGRRRATKQESEHIRRNLPKAPPRDEVYTDAEVRQFANVSPRRGFKTERGERLTPRVLAVVDAFAREGRTYCPRIGKVLSSPALSKQRRAELLQTHVTSAEIAARVGCAQNTVTIALRKIKNAKAENVILKTPAYAKPIKAFIAKHGNIDAVRAMRDACNNWLKENK